PSPGAGASRPKRRARLAGDRWPYPPVKRGHHGGLGRSASLNREGQGDLRTWKGGTRHVRRVRCPTTLRRPDLVRLKIARRTVPQNLPGPKEPKTGPPKGPKYGALGALETVSRSLRVRPVAAASSCASSRPSSTALGRAAS